MHIQLSRVCTHSTAVNYFHALFGERAARLTGSPEHAREREGEKSNRTQNLKG